MDILKQFPYLPIMNKLLDKYLKAANSILGINPLNSNPNKKRKKRKSHRRK